MTDNSKATNEKAHWKTAQEKFFHGDILGASLEEYRALNAAHREALSPEAVSHWEKGSELVKGLHFIEASIEELRAITSAGTLRGAAPVVKKK